jgi:PAS domain S-box-containing protein
VRQTGIPTKNQTRVRHKLGHWVWVESTLLGWIDDSANYHTLCYSRDISDIKRVEASKRESEARYSVVTQMSRDLITELDQDGRHTYVGPGSEEILGYTVEEVLDLEPWSLLHPEDQEQVRAQFEKQFVAPPDVSRHNRGLNLIEYRVRHKDGRWLWFDTQGVPYPRADGKIRYLAVNRDVSERVLAEQARREYEESMQRSQKLESLGVLAGGIAHDFNNLLTPILGAAALGALEVPNDSPVRAHLETIQRAAKRAAALTNQMLAYAGQKPLRVEHLDFSVLVEEMRELVTSSVAGKTAIDLKLERDLPFVEGESAQLSQVIMNLISNAAEALAEGTGQIVIRTGVVSIVEWSADVLFGETMPLGEHVYFEVSDTGCGMDKETLDRIFDPFFTTKFTGRGLGLAAVAGIVRGHRGGIKVTSDPGSGTCFRVMFPAVHRPATQPSGDPTPARPFRSTGTVLVIDDDEGVRELTEEVLRRAGMTVLTAADGHEGVKLFERHADDICVVLLDRTMPSLSGADTFDAIRAIRDQAKIVLVSGYSEERVTAELADRGLAGFLKKPFLPDTLLLRVQEVLDPNP